jgi:hypothetical protein
MRGDFSCPAQASREVGKTMKRAAILIACVTILAAQSSRDSYRSAYAEWRQADPNLERDAGVAAAGFPARVAKVGQAAAKYGTAHAAFLRASAEDGARTLATLGGSGAAGAIPNRDLRPFAATETKKVQTTLKAFESDRSAAIGQVRLALVRERAALAALSSSMDQRIAASAKAASAAGSAQKAATTAAAQYAELNKAILDAAAIADKETAAWADYYQKLGTASAPGPATISSAQGVPPLPLLRYIGTWSFPPTSSAFTGVKPEFVDLAVHQENGQVTGSFYGRFVTAGKSDPVLRFDFSGPLTPTRIQRFDLETAEGAKGFIELIPGGAINLLEINFHTDPKPGKLQQGDLVLLKR